MNRRALLAGASTIGSGILTGCLESAVAAVNEQPLHSVAVTDVAPPAASQLEFTLRVEEAQVTTASTARVQLTYTNTGETEATVRHAWWRILVSSLPRPRLMLVPVGGGDLNLTRRESDCWHPTEDVAHPLVADGTTVGPAESFTQVYEVWGHDGEDASHPCIQRTSYGFDLGRDGQFTLAVEPPS